MKKVNYIASVTTPEDLRPVYDYVLEILGPDITSYEQFKSMYDKNRNISPNIKRIDSNGNMQIKGFLSLSFLTSEAVDALKNKALTTMQLTGDHQAQENEVPLGLYIGAVGACPNDRNARVFTMRYLFNTIGQYKEGFGCDILSRPVSDVGMKITQSLKLKPMHSEEGLNHIYIS